jgi:hypothetical protein
MPFLLRPISLALAALLACLPPAAAAQEQRSLGLMGTIPIYWGESDGFDALLAGDAEPHWARAALETDFALEPLDYLSADAIAPFKYLLLAQPRALSGEENVALDAWVRAGGRLLLFADPLMTGHTRFSLGDRRRPMDVTLLSPILAHWGLQMEFDDRQPSPSRIHVEGAAIPVNFPGRFVTPGNSGDCTLSGEAILARCALGAGSATILADGAMLDLHHADPAAPDALRALVILAFGDPGENAGR